MQWAAFLARRLPYLLNSRKVLCDFAAEIECRISWLTVRERYWSQDFRSHKHGSFSCIHCWFNIRVHCWFNIRVKIRVISATGNAWFSCVRAMNTECPERQFMPLKFGSSCGCGQYLHHSTSSAARSLTDFLQLTLRHVSGVSLVCHSEF